MATANVRDVAALAGVSVGTVSNVLNRSKRVSPETEKRVREAIASLGFVRNDAARQLRVGRSRTVGMIVLDVSNPFFTDVSIGVEDSLAEHNRSLVLANSRHDAEREQAHLDLFEQQRVAGLLITPSHDITGELERLQSRGTPVVLVDAEDPSGTFSSVVVDDYAGGVLAMTHLLEMGRVRPALVGAAASMPQVRQRIRGAESVISKFPGVEKLRLVETESMTSEAGRLAVEKLLELPKAERPDAIFAANDLIALGVLQALIAIGVKVPETVAIVGYHDIAFAASAAIPLTSIRQPAVAMGVQASELLLAHIEAENANEDIPKPRAVVFDPELIIRTSTTG